MNSKILSWLHLYSGSNSFNEDKVDKLRYFVAKLGIKIHCPVITISGTNGKGTCVALYESLAIAGNLSVATYTSPHNLVFNDRLKINGSISTDRQWLDAFHKVDKVLVGDNYQCSFFDFVTLSALVIVAELDIDLLVLEVGLGGLFDSVRAVEPSLCMITNIDLDHQDRLGVNKFEIALQKVGIVESSCPVVVVDPSSVTYISRWLYNYNNIHISSSDFYSDLGDCTLFRYKKMRWLGKRVDSDLKPVLLSVLMGFSLLGFDLGFSLLPDRINRPFGRCQYSYDGFHSWLDVSHNASSVLRLANALSAQSNLMNIGKTVAVFALQSSKDYISIINNIKKEIDVFYLYDKKEGSFYRADFISDYMTSVGLHNIIFTDKKLLHDDIISGLGKDDRLVIFGSFALLSDFNGLLFRYVV